MIDSARFMVLNAAWKMDTVGNKIAKKEIAMIKVLAPTMACQVIDWAMQVYGGAGVSDDTPLAHMYAGARTIRFADGPDEVHRNAIAKLELAKHMNVNPDSIKMPVAPRPIASWILPKTSGSDCCRSSTRPPACRIDT